MELSNRELAALLWIAIFLAWSIFKSKGAILPTFFELLRRLFAPRLAALWLLAALWVALCVIGLGNLHLWTYANLKTTLLWAATSIVVAVMDAVRLGEKDSYFFEAARDNFSATLVITFISEAYSFPFVVELTLFPILAFMTAVQVVASKETSHAPAHKFATTILAIAGASYVVYGFYMAVADVQNSATWTIARDFFIPIALSLLFLPFLFGVSVLVAYEQLGASLRWSVKDPALRYAALLQGATAFFGDREGLRRWKRQLGLFPPENNREVRASIAGVRAGRLRERNPAVVSPEIGWSPPTASAFLTGFGITTSDYHPIDDQQWWASSQYKELNAEALMPDNIAYYVSGTSVTANRLKVVLNVNGTSDTQCSDSVFQRVCMALIQHAVPTWQVRDWPELCSQDFFDVQSPYCRVILKREPFVNAAKGFSRTLIIEHNSVTPP